MKDIPIEQMDECRLRVELSSALTANKLLLEANEKLEKREQWLYALEAAGVDNWEGYDEALEILKEVQNET